jgi:hypothetical protein
MEFACTRHSAVSVPLTPCMDDCTPVELRMKELIGVWRGVAIVTGDGCPHESLTMNDPPLLTGTHTHTHTQQSLLSVPPLSTDTHSKTSTPLNSTICGFVCYCCCSYENHCFTFDTAFYIYKVLFIYFIILTEYSTQISTYLFPS